MARVKSLAETIGAPVKGSVKDKVLKGPKCPKCGQHEGWSGPSYQRGERVTVKRPHKPTAFRSDTLETVESLVFTCKSCNYKRHEPCKDSMWSESGGHND